MNKPYNIGMTAGTFDVLNVGHISILRKAKAKCKYLVVAVNDDDLILKFKGVKPIMPIEERAKIVSELKCVDKVIVQYTLVDINIFNEIKAEMFFVGDDYKHRDDIEGIHWLKERNLITFFPYTKKTSSSIIKRRIITNADAILNAQKSRKLNG